LLALHEVACWRLVGKMAKSKSRFCGNIAAISRGLSPHVPTDRFRPEAALFLASAFQSIRIAVVTFIQCSWGEQRLRPLDEHVSR
jgi:hypothetical protein